LRSSCASWRTWRGCTGTTSNSRTRLSRDRGQPSRKSEVPPAYSCVLDDFSNNTFRQLSSPPVAYPYRTGAGLSRRGLPGNAVRISSKIRQVDYFQTPPLLGQTLITMTARNSSPLARCIVYTVRWPLTTSLRSSSTTMTARPKRRPRLRGQYIHRPDEMPDLLPTHRAATCPPCRPTRSPGGAGETSPRRTRRPQPFTASGTGNVPRPYSLNPRLLLYLTLLCIMLLCTYGFKFISAARCVKSWRSTRT
jgi:hypothetical protein